MPYIPLTHANIINLLGIESLPLDERKEIVMKAIELVEVRTFNRIIDQLKGQSQKQFIQALEKDNEDMIARLLEENKIDLLALSEEEIEKMKWELLELAKD